LAGAGGWADVPVLEGGIVGLEPLSSAHEQGLWEASRDPQTWRWLSVLQPETPEEWHEYMEQALAGAEAGREIPFATVSRATDRPIGSAPFLSPPPPPGAVQRRW